MATKESKGGRPARYGDEKPIRIGASIRPRYKEMLDIISRHRNSSMNEALEFMIAATSRYYAIDNESVFDWVVSSEPMILQLYATTIDTENLSQDEKNENLEQVSNYLEKQTKPLSFLNNLEKYILEILISIEYQLLLLDDEVYEINDDFESDVLISKYFDTNRLFEVMEELWRSAERIDAVALGVSVINTAMHPRFNISKLKDAAIKENVEGEFFFPFDFKYPIPASVAKNNQDDFDHSATLLDFAYTVVAQNYGLNDLKYMLGEEGSK